MQLVLFALWFFAPAGVANSAPVFANKIPLLSRLGMPIDYGKSFRGKRIFGSHKTVRGFVVGIVFAVLTAALQMFLYINFDWFENLSRYINYSDPIVLLMGAFMGFGALAGDAIKSFFKRQMSIPSGQSWFPFDQIDYIIGGIVFTLPFVSLDTEEYLVVFIVWFVIHPIATFIGWLLRLKDKPI